MPPRSDTSFSNRLMWVLRARGPMTTAQIRQALPADVGSDLISSYLTMLYRRGYVQKQLDIEATAASSARSYRRYVWSAVPGARDPKIGRPKAPQQDPPPLPAPAAVVETPDPPPPRRRYARTYDGHQFVVVWDGTDATA